MEAKKNFVSIKDESVRMFENNLLDSISRVHWTTPLYFWVPVVLACVYMSLFSESYAISFVNFAVHFLIGFVIWTISEYILHRFVFHYHATSEWGKRINFITHGVHHDYPNDSLRLVMPLSLSLPLSLPFLALFYYLFGVSGNFFGAFAGLVVGYLSYDMLHYALHYAKWDNKYFNNLKHHHMYHHYKDPERGFGVSSKFWDYVFFTKFRKNE